jgi:hypothetical protein
VTDGQTIVIHILGLTESFFRKERPLTGFVSFQYFDRTNEVFESLLRCDKLDGLESADTMLVELQERQISIGTFVLA